jgi:hypothetical protein
LINIGVGLQQAGVQISRVLPPHGKRWADSSIATTSAPPGAAFQYGRFYHAGADSTGRMRWPGARFSRVARAQLGGSSCTLTAFSGNSVHLPGQPFLDAVGQTGWRWRQCRRQVAVTKYSLRLKRSAFTQCHWCLGVVGVNNGLPVVGASWRNVFRSSSRGGCNGLSLAKSAGAPLTFGAAQYAFKPVRWGLSMARQASTVFIQHRVGCLLKAAVSSATSSGGEPLCHDSSMAFHAPLKF